MAIIPSSHKTEENRSVVVWTDQYGTKHQIIVPDVVWHYPVSSKSYRDLGKVTREATDTVWYYPKLV